MNAFIDAALFSPLPRCATCLYCQAVPQRAKKRVTTAELGVRDRLLDAADRLFYQEGVRAVGIDRVLSEADAAKASVSVWNPCSHPTLRSRASASTGCFSPRQ